MLWPVAQTFCVDTAGVQAMAARWGALAGDLDETVTPNKDGQVVTAWPNNHHGWRH
jgi:hypothetical protein